MARQEDHKGNKHCKFLSMCSLRSFVANILHNNRRAFSAALRFGVLTPSR